MNTPSARAAANPWPVPRPSWLAVAWLNEHVAPEGYVFLFSDGLMLWEESDDLAW